MTNEEYEAFNNFIHTLLYERMTDDDYDDIMAILGAQKRGGRFQTVCHHADAHEGGYNLAYMPQTRTFYCHSQCECSYSLLSLIRQNRALQGLPNSTYQSLKWLCEQLGVPFNFTEEVGQINTDVYHWQSGIAKYAKRVIDEEILPTYDKSDLECLPKVYHESWINYGITEAVLEKFNIRWYYRNQIVIPCYDENGTLVGIRCRNVNPTLDWKYMPFKWLDGKQYNFPTNSVFFGENFNAVNVQRTRECMLVEAEKTVMKYDVWYGGENNITLGIYGSAFGKAQLRKLLQWGVQTVYIALDSDFTEITEICEANEKDEFNRFFKKVMKIYDTLKPYIPNIYVIYNNLGYENCYKFSPTDYTKEQYEALFNNKERIN